MGTHLVISEYNSLLIFALFRWISRRDAEKVMDLSESRKAVEETDVTQKRASITPILQLGKGDARVLPPPDDWEVVPVGGKKKISTSQPPNSKAPFKPDNRSSQLKNNSKSKNIAVANLPVTDTRKKLVLTKEAVSPGFTDERLADHPSAGSANSNATIYRESGLNKSDLSIFFVSVDEFVLNFNGDSALSECALCIKELVHQQNMDDAVKVIKFTILLYFPTSNNITFFLV